MKAHVYYLGWKTLGIIGMTDASECIPTYGAGAVYSVILLYDTLFQFVNLTNE